MDIEDRSLLPVQTEFEKLQRLYKANIEPIRHLVFAHAGKIKREELNAHFTKVLLRDLERMAVFPLRLERSLSGLYNSGTAPTLEPVPTNMVEILNNLPADTSDTWEHFHAVRSTAKMAAWMKLTPAPPEKIDSSIIEKLARQMELEALDLKEEDFEESASSKSDGAPA